MLIAVLSVFEEEALLPGCLESLEGKVDRVVVADGRYALFPGEHGPSRDRTVEIALEFGAEVIASPPRGWKGEEVKRTRLARCGRPGDHYLVIDADERLHGGERLRDLHGDWRIQIYDIDLEREMRLRAYPVRLFAHRNRLRYLWHCELVTPSGFRVLRTHNRVPGEDAMILHINAHRDSERLRLKEDYYRLQAPYERSLGAQWG